VIEQATSAEDKALIDRLRNEIKQRQQENKKLETEIARVNKMLTGSYSQKEVVKNLNTEIER
jgi:Skp family chaperone for outer membrane proteins